MLFRNDHLTLNANYTSQFPNTISECMNTLCKHFNWYRSTFRPTSNYFKNIDGYNDVVFIRNISLQGKVGSTRECVNTISPDGDLYSEQFIQNSALKKWQFDPKLPPRLLFILVKDKNNSYFKFLGIYRILSESTKKLRIYARISTTYDRKKPNNYTKEN